MTKNIHRGAAPRGTPDGFIPGSLLDRRSAPDVLARFASGSYNATARTVDAIATTSAPVRRWGINEVLEISAEAIDLTRVATGQVRLLDSHSQSSIADILGTITKAWIEGDKLMVTARFADTEEGRAAESMVASGDVSALSVGYKVSSWTISVDDAADTETWVAARWELLEVSLVAVPADGAAMIRAAAVDNSTPTPSLTLENDDMRRNALSADADNQATQAAPSVAPFAATVPAQAPIADAATILRSERDRIAGLQDIATRANMPITDIQAAIASGTDVESFRAAAFARLTAAQPNTSHIRVERDETETRRSAMEESIARRLGEKGDISEGARQYMDYSLIEIAAERLGVRRVGSDIASREDILRRAMHTTTDMPILFENAVNRSLAPSYQLAAPTYREISVREDFNDFRPHTTVSVGDFPMLEAIGEAGEIKFGTIGEKKETIAISSYAIGLAFSRQALINDSLSGLAAVIAKYGQSVALREEQIAYAVKALNSGDGPTLLEGSAAMFTTGRTNKAAANSAITIAAVGLGRAAMRGYRSIPSGKPGDTGNELLYNAPSIILVGPSKETEAEQFVSTQIMPGTRAEVNVFQGKLRTLVTPMITGNSWELYTDPTVRANFRWGLLNGYAAPRVRVENPFGSQGTQMSVEHDFGFGAIDWRAAYRNAGA